MTYKAEETLSIYSCFKKWSARGLCFLFTMLAYFCQGQTLNYRQFTFESGLPSNEVHDIEQDTNGYMWFATDRGLSRYDGQNFTNFTTEDGLPDNTIHEIYEDYKGRLWFVSFSNKLSYYENGRIKLYRYNDTIPRAYKGADFCLFTDINVDHQDNLHYSMLGVDMVIDSSGRWHIPERPIGGTFTYFEGEHMYFTHRRLRPSKKRKTAVPVTIDFGDTLLQLRNNVSPAFRNYSLKLDRDHWIFSLRDGMMICHKDDRRYFSSDLALGFINDNDRLLIASVNGLQSLDWRDRDAEVKTLIPGFMITSLHRDHQGGIWLSTYNHGVLYIRNTEVRWLGRGTLPISQISAITTDDMGNMYMGGMNGELMMCDVEGNLKWSVSHPDIRGRVYHVAGYDEKLYVGAITRKVHFLDPTTTPPLVDSIADERLNACKYMTMTPDSKLIISGNLGMASLSDAGLNFMGSPNMRLHCIEAGVGGEIFMGTVTGLYTYKDGEVYYLGDENDLLKAPILSLNRLANGSLAVGTNGSGLLIYSRHGVQRFSKEDGLSSNMISCLESDDEYLWVGSGSGTNRLDLSGIESGVPEIESISVSHGLASNNIHQIHSDGRNVYIATDHGVNFFPADTRFTDPFPLIKLLSANVLGSDFTVAPDQVLDWDQNRLRFEFKAISFPGTNDLEYEYRLLGLEDDWNVTSSKIVEFSNLDAGLYSFEIRVRGTEAVRNLSFVVSMPFWERPLFVVFSISAVIAIFIFIVRRRELAIRKDFERKTAIDRQMNQLKLEASRARMNPHFTFNVLSSIQDFVLKNESLEASDYLSRFADLIRKVLEHSNKVEISLREELELLENYVELQNLRMDSMVQFNYAIDPDLNIETRMLPPGIIQPFVENAIIHGLMPKSTDRQLTILFTLEDGNLKCIIEDNGVGRNISRVARHNEKEDRKSLGISISKTQLDILWDHSITDSIKLIDLYDEKREPRGTRVEIIFPSTPAKTPTNEEINSNYS